MVTAMGRHAENAKVQEEACGALGNLAFNAENGAKIGAQVENMHEFICDYMWPSHGRRSEMSQRAIANTHTHAGGD